MSYGNYDVKNLAAPIPGARGRHTHQRPHGEHIRHVFAHLADGREVDGVPVHGAGHPHDVRVQPRDRAVDHHPDDGRGRLPAAEVVFVAAAAAAVFAARRIGCRTHFAPK